MITIIFWLREFSPLLAFNNQPPLFWTVSALADHGSSKWTAFIRNNNNNNNQGRGGPVVNYSDSYSYFLFTSTVLFVRDRN